MFFQKKLSTIFDNHKGKVSDKWYSHIDAYSEDFDCYRAKKVNLLEIGSQNCSSLEVWSKYFNIADLIFGTDIEPFVKSFFHKLSIKINFETLRKNFKMIHNIRFYNSMCFIYEGHIPNHVGTRAARGNATPIIKPGNEDTEYIKKISN